MSESSTILIPYESLLGRAVVRPVLSEEIYNVINAAIVPITHKTRWEKWGMNRQNKKGTKLLLTGGPGTGKSTVARWLAKEVTNSIISVTMADVGSNEPGATERNIRSIFETGKKKDNATLFLDECDAMLWSREHVGSDSMFMLGIINQLLIQIEKYDGLVIMATNFSKVLDPALARRLSYIIEIPRPDLQTRIALWEQKIPSNYPLKLNELQIKILAENCCTGAEIETAIDQATRSALLKGRKPTFQDLQEKAFALEDKTERGNTKAKRVKKIIRLGKN